MSCNAAKQKGCGMSVKDNDTYVRACFVSGKQPSCKREFGRWMMRSDWSTHCGAVGKHLKDTIDGWNEMQEFLEECEKEST